MLLFLLLDGNEGVVKEISVSGSIRESNKAETLKFISR